MAANGNDIISNMHLDAVYKDAFVAIGRCAQEYTDHLTDRCARRNYTFREDDAVQTKYALPECERTLQHATPAVLPPYSAS